jgi:hypothetical protein
VGNVARGCAIVHAVRPHETQGSMQDNLCEVCGGGTGSGAGFCVSNKSSPSQPSFYNTP